MPLLELPHWLMIVGAVLVVVGLFGLAFSRRNKAELEPELLPGDLDSWKAQQPRSLSDRGRSAA
jgi:hypothetical protein